MNQQEEQQKYCRYFTTQKGCDKGTECKFKHDESKKQNNAVFCKYFTSKKGCSKGDECPFVHTAVFSKPPMKDPSTIPCKFKSNCTKGDACPFFHPSNQNTTLNHIPCKFGLHCKRGETCKFNHVKACDDGDNCQLNNCHFGHYMTHPGTSCKSEGECVRENCYLDH
ncbi:hypothetical protein Indivirus_1_160 [Indivirus ILV1]|uniref:C3H1-type domain-containing protein n=1 Tax=Indivirus ILV1 TaxID=1977633 RepID=A0A1V0SCU5_9VIRU|nr:hypothetical protein Indivirus_1_160 [Indivirus ILV1]